MAQTPTAGPWKARLSKAAEPYRDPVSADVIGAHGGFVADCGSHEYADGNALLIATAPDMLAELKRIAASDECCPTCGTAPHRADCGLVGLIQKAEAHG